MLRVCLLESTQNCESTLRLVWSVRWGAFRFGLGVSGLEKYPLESTLERVPFREFPFQKLPSGPFRPPSTPSTTYYS